MYTCEDIKYKNHGHNISSTLYLCIHCYLLLSAVELKRHEKVICLSDIRIGQGPGNRETARFDQRYSRPLQGSRSYHSILPATISLEKIICCRLIELKKAISNNLATAKRWPRPLNRGGRLIGFRMQQ